MKKTFTILLLAAIHFGSYAQANQELNSLILQSFTYFPRIKELNKTTELRELQIELSQSSYLPSVSGVGSYTYLNPISQKALPIGPNETANLKFQPYNNYNLNVAVNQVVWDFGKIHSQIEKSKADLLVAKQNTEVARLQLAAQVASVYYSMIYLKKSVVVQDSVISFYRENRKIVEGKIKQGDALQIDLSNIENNIDQEQNRKVEFLRQYERQAALMRFSTGQSAEPSSADFDFKSIEGAADVSNNPEVLAASERISSAKADAKLAESNKLPVLSVQAGAGFKNGYQPDINPLRFNYLGGLTLNVPIFQGGKLGQSVKLAHKTVELNEYSKATLTSTLQKDLESVLSDIKAYNEQMKNADGQIAVANESQRLTQVRYKQGIVTYLDLINASTNVQRAYLNKLQYEYQRTVAQIELYRLTGSKFWQEQ
jgi:outer membrane protein TolC